MSKFDTDLLSAFENYIEYCVSPAEIESFKTVPASGEFEYIALHIQKCPHCREIYELSADGLIAAVKKAVEFDMRTAENAFKNPQKYEGIFAGDIFLLRTDYDRGLIESQIYAAIVGDTGEDSIAAAPLCFDIHLGGPGDFYILPGGARGHCGEKTLLAMASSPFVIRKERLYEKAGRLSEFHANILNHLTAGPIGKSPDKIKYPDGLNIVSVSASPFDKKILLNGRPTMKSIEEIESKYPQILITPATVPSESKFDPVNLFRSYRRLKAYLYLKDVVELGGKTGLSW